ncbi:hypothetical protein OGA32_000097 [Salmonella enterica]|nr:hypothetical protein [Salmonella enterica]
MHLVEVNYHNLTEALYKLLNSPDKKLHTPKIFIIDGGNGEERNSPRLDKFYFTLFKNSLLNEEKTPIDNELSPTGNFSIDTRDLARKLNIPHAVIFEMYKFIVDHFDDSLTIEKDGNTFMIYYVNRMYEHCLGIRKTNSFTHRQSTEHIKNF